MASFKITFDEKYMENVPQTDNEPVCHGGYLVDSITLYNHLHDWDSNVRANFLRHYTHAIVWYHNKRVEFLRYNGDGIQRCYISFD